MNNITIVLSIFIIIFLIIIAILLLGLRKTKQELNEVRAKYLEAMLENLKVNISRMRILSDLAEKAKVLEKKVKQETQEEE